MAGCHLRSQVLLQSRLLATKACYARLSDHSRSIFNISQLSKDHQQHHVPYNRKEYTCLTTNIQNFDSTQLRYIHCSRRALYPDKEKDTTPETENANKSDLKDNVDFTKPDQSAKGEAESAPEKLSVFQRFKKTYKEHGKVLVGVHLVTSAVWFGSFFYAAKVGVDIIPVLEWLGLPDKVINPFRNSSLGDVALAYLMYKLATPARYTVTLTGTNFAIKYLRKAGKMQPKDKSASLRALAKDSRAELRKKRGEVQIRTKKLETNLKEGRGKVKDRLKKFRSKLKDRQLKSLAARKSKRPPRSKK